MNKKEPQPEGRIPPCPEHLGIEAHKEWERMSIELHRLGLLTNLDRAIFAAYCQAWETWVEATKEVTTDGYIVKAANGFPMQNPFLSVRNKAEDQMIRTLTELGMSPSSRSRIKVEKPKENSPEDEFLKPGQNL